MADISGLQFFWFILIGVLFAGFFFLEGFDLESECQHVF